MPGVVLGNGRVVLTSFGGALLGAAMLFSSLSRANFLDDLFGPEDYFHAPAGPRITAPPSTRGARRQVERARPHVASFPSYRRERPRKAQIAYIPRGAEAAGGESATGSAPVRPAFCARNVNALDDASRFRQLLNDKTLRFGDIVVTTAGLRVFEGHATCPHLSRDFVSLGAAGLSRRRLVALAKLEDSIRLAHSHAHR